VPTYPSPPLPRAQGGARAQNILAGSPPILVPPSEDPGWSQGTGYPYRVPTYPSYVLFHDAHLF